MASHSELAWAAGLFEGEGSFTVFRNGRGYKYPQARIAMTDLDVLERFASIMGFGNVNGPYDSLGVGGKRRTPIYCWAGNGFEKTQHLIATFWPHLGTRRRARAREVLQLASTHY